MGLVTRGNLGPYANTVEDAQIELTSRLQAGTKYDFSIDLAFSTAFGHFGDTDFVSYANPAKLKIWGGVNSCEKTELLWESPTIDHTNWRTYFFSITPILQGFKYLILEANYVTSPTYFGNVLIDNIIENKLPEPEPVDCNLKTFNVFTPNGDGYNDVFLFKSDGPIARFNFQIFNKWGVLMFETNDIQQGWDGKNKGRECATGVYFWYVHYMCIKDNTITEFERKGTVTMLK